MKLCTRRNANSTILVQSEVPLTHTRTRIASCVYALANTNSSFHCSRTQFLNKYY